MSSLSGIFQKVMDPLGLFQSDKPETPPPPPPPPAAPEPPPAAPVNTAGEPKPAPSPAAPANSAVGIGTEARRRASAASGVGGTILTGSQGLVTPASTTTKNLLGE